jgi:hypothetical protein
MAPRFDIQSFNAAVGGIATTLGLDILAVSARFYIRNKQRQKLGLHDWLVVAALVRPCHSKISQLSYCDSFSILVWQQESFMECRKTSCLAAASKRSRDLNWQAGYKRLTKRSKRCHLHFFCTTWVLSDMLRSNSPYF